MIASTMNNVQPRVGDNLDDLTAINMWLERLDTKFNFSQALGPLLVALSSSNDLLTLQKLDPPFLKNTCGISKMKTKNRGAKNPSGKLSHQ